MSIIIEILGGGYPNYKIELMKNKVDCKKKRVWGI